MSSLLLDGDGVYRDTRLASLLWLEHGFGTALSPSWPGDRAVVTLKQVHSNQVVVADGRLGEVGEGDALISARSGLLLTIRTADCIPILVADPITHSVASVHAGWRGTVAGIAREAVLTMQQQFGARPADLIAAVGPGIGKCCFEVGPEVSAEFGLQGRARIDLAEANRLQLVQSGLPEGQISTSGFCTFCGGELFHSFRRDGQASGRMIAGIGIRAF